MLMSEYFRAMEAVVARHGGIVEKFIGDAVMAVFGVPVLHEDDALRAVRTAAEMRESLAALNETFEKTWGMRLQARIGINSGEVMAGDHLQGHLIVTGRAVTAAKRFEEAAAANEILISEVTHRLVRDAVVAERVSDRVVKGGETLDGLRDRRGAAAHGGPSAPLRHAARRSRAGVRRAAQRLRECRRDQGVSSPDRARRSRGRQVAPRAGVRAGGRRRGDGAARPLPALRRGHHVLAARGSRPRPARARSPRVQRSPPCFQTRSGPT